MMERPAAGEWRRAVGMPADATLIAYEGNARGRWQLRGCLRSGFALFPRDYNANSLTRFFAVVDEGFSISASRVALHRKVTGAGGSTMMLSRRTTNRGGPRLY